VNGGEHELMVGRGNILIVDDEQTNRDVLANYITSLGHVPHVAKNGAEALAHVEQQPPDLILLDILMPEMDGHEVLERLQAGSDTRHIPVVVVSALDDMERVVRCIKAGALDYTTKPFDGTLLEARIDAALARKRSRDIERDLLEGTLTGSIKVLQDILALVSPVSFSRATQVRGLVVRMAGPLGLTPVWPVEVAALLSQSGCVTVPNEVLAKAYYGETLLPDEQRVYEAYPKIGHDLVANIPRLGEVAEIISLQQKHYDGTGAPEDDGRKGEQIPLGARVLHVGLAFDAMTPNGATAVARMRRQEGKYDPAALDALEDVLAVGPGEPRCVHMHELLSGMVLAEDLVTEAGVLVLARGQEITLPVKQRLAHFRAPMREPVRVYVQDPGQPVDLE